MLKRPLFKGAIEKLLFAIDRRNAMKNGVNRGVSMVSSRSDSLSDGDHYSVAEINGSIEIDTVVVIVSGLDWDVPTRIIKRVVSVDVSYFIRRCYYLINVRVLI